MKKAIYSEELKYLTGRLRQARREAGLSQEDVAELLEVSQSCVSKVEAGQRRVDVVQLMEFAKLYRKPLSFFVRATAD